MTKGRIRSHQGCSENSQWVRYVTMTQPVLPIFIPYYELATDLYFFLHLQFYSFPECPHLLQTQARYDDFLEEINVDMT